MPLSLNVVPQDMVEETWPVVGPIIERALKYGEGDRQTLESMKAALVSGQAMLWVTRSYGEIVGTIVVKLVDYPNKRAVFVELIAGDAGTHNLFAKSFGAVNDMLKRFKKLNKADTIEASCRPGLARILERRGWKPKAVVMEAK